MRLSQTEVDALDGLTVGQFSRSQVMRIVLQEFLRKSEKEQRKFLTSKRLSDSDTHTRNRDD